LASGLVLNRSRQVPAEETPAFGGIAERFRRAGDLDRAIALCREGLQKFPDSLSARVTLGWALLDHGKYEDARQELEQVLKRAPDNLAAIRGLAELHDRAENAVELPLDGPGPWPPPPDAESLKTASPAKAEDRHAPHAKHEPPPAAVPVAVIEDVAPVELAMAPPIEPAAVVELPAPVREMPVAASSAVLDEFVPLRVEALGEVIPNVDLIAEGPEPFVLDASLLPETAPAPAPAAIDDAVLLTADDLTLGPLEDIQLLPTVADAPAEPMAGPATVDLTSELTAPEAESLDAWVTPAGTAAEPVSWEATLETVELGAAAMAAEPAPPAVAEVAEIQAAAPVEEVAAAPVPDDGFVLTPGFAQDGITDEADDEAPEMMADEFSRAFDFDAPLPPPPSLNVLEGLLRGVAARRITAASEYHLAS
jgi:hypothetical protein